MKPKPHSPTAVRDKYIRAKYQHLSFTADKQHQQTLPLLAATTAAADYRKQGQDLLLSAIADDALLLVAFTAIVCHGALTTPTSTSTPPLTPLLLPNDHLYLHRSACAGSLLCAVLLIVSGADLTRTDVNGKLAVDIARDNGHDSLCNYISRKMSVGNPRRNTSFKPLDQQQQQQQQQSLATVVIDNSAPPSPSPSPHSSSLPLSSPHTARVHSHVHDALVKQMVENALSAAIEDKNDSNP